MVSSALARPLEQLPGFRLRFRITPAQSCVQSEVEDDYHCMSVVVRHGGAAATGIEAEMRRVPWTTCPGAVEQLKQTFVGVALDAFASRGEKQANCTHLHDLAVLAATHAYGTTPLVYDILVSDPVDGIRRAELRCGGVTVLPGCDLIAMLAGGAVPATSQDRRLAAPARAGRNPRAVAANGARTGCRYQFRYRHLTTVLFIV